MVVLLLPLVAAILLINDFFPFQKTSDGKRLYGFVIHSAPHPTARCERFETRTLEGDKVFLYLLRDSMRALPVYGDTVVAKTAVEWMHRTGRAFAAHYDVLPARKPSVPLAVRLYKRLASAGLEGDELATVGALTLGYKDDIAPEVRRHFQASGAAHVLAVSGLHTGIIYGLLIGLLTLGGLFKPMHENKWGRRTLSAVIIAGMWGYAWLTGMTPSVVRAVLMVTIVEIGRMLYREAISLNTIAAAAVLILLTRPTDLWSVSFQLSFAATASIVLFMSSLRQYITLSAQVPKIVRYFLGIMVVSLAAQIGTMPITMYYFGQVSTYFLLTNLIVLPLAGLLVPGGLVCIVLGGSVLGRIACRATFSLAWLMNHSVGWIESLPGSTLQANVNGTMIAVYYTILLLFFAFMRFSKFR